MKTKNANRSAHDTYLELVRKFPLTRIRDDDHLQEAIDMINSLSDRPVDACESEYLETLVTLVEVYESSLSGFRDVTTASVIRHLMDANGDTQSTLSKRSGISKSLLSEILSGERQVTLAAATKLAAAYCVPKSVFIE